MDKRIYREYVAILKEELQPAMGCTEPIAVAYCAALARQTLDALPETVEVLASANIIKNVKSVIVPNTNGLRGIAAAAAMPRRPFVFGTMTLLTFLMMFALASTSTVSGSASSVWRASAAQ